MLHFSFLSVASEVFRRRKPAVRPTSVAPTRVSTSPPRDMLQPIMFLLQEKSQIAQDVQGCQQFFVVFFFLHISAASLLCWAGSGRNNWSRDAAVFTHSGEEKSNTMTHWSLLSFQYNSRNVASFPSSLVTLYHTTDGLAEEKQKSISTHFSFYPTATDSWKMRFQCWSHLLFQGFVHGNLWWVECKYSDQDHGQKKHVPNVLSKQMLRGRLNIILHVVLGKFRTLRTLSSSPTRL